MTNTFHLFTDFPSRIYVQRKRRSSCSQQVNISSMCKTTTVLLNRASFLLKSFSPAFVLGAWEAALMLFIGVLRIFRLWSEHGWNFTRFSLTSFYLELKVWPAGSVWVIHISFAYFDKTLIFPYWISTFQSSFHETFSQANGLGGISALFWFSHHISVVNIFSRPIVH